MSIPELCLKWVSLNTGLPLEQFLCWTAPPPRVKLQIQFWTIFIISDPWKALWLIVKKKSCSCWKAKSTKYSPTRLNSSSSLKSLAPLSEKTRMCYHLNHLPNLASLSNSFVRFIDSVPFFCRHYFTMLCLSSLLQLLRPASWVPAGIVAVVWIHQTGEHRSCGRTRRGNKFEASGLSEHCRRQVTDRRKCKFVLLEANHFSAAKINLRLNNMPAKQI